jgi:glycosyltransferase involved in cell wall biosynthesis
MRKSPKVSIIVPCYNQAEYLPETLNSVLAQTYSNWECVIVNDGSPDNTDTIAKEYLKKDNRIKYVYQENKGLATARNTGIANSTGEYILPLDADDLIAPTYIEKAIDRFSQFPETKLVYCKGHTFGSSNHPMVLADYDYDTFIWGNCIFCSALYRRSDYDKTPGYNANMVYGLEDWDFWLYLLKKDDVVYRIDEVLFYYRVKETSMVKELVSHHLEDNLIQLCKNHPDIYKPYNNRLVLYHSYLEEIERLKKEINKIQSSRAYRLGKTIAKPFFYIKKERIEASKLLI